MMKRQTIITSLCFLLVISILFGIGTYPQLKVGDFKPHIQWAKDLAENAYIDTPHTLYQQLVVIVRALIPFNVFSKLYAPLKIVADKKSYDIAGYIVSMLCYLFTGFIIFRRFYNKWKTSLADHADTVSWIASIIALIVSPIILFTLKDRLILGYVPGNVLHSPTYLLLRPFALLLFFFLVDHFNQKSSYREWLVAALLIVFSTLSKPNFTLSILPAVALIVFLHIKEGSFRNWSLSFSMAVPAGLLLIVQYFISYTGDTSNQIIFAPFKAALYYTHNLGNVFLFLLLSLAFPLSILIINWKTLNKDLAFQFAWINFLAGLAIFYLFTEDARIASLNFLWGPMLGVFIIFIQSIEVFGFELIRKRSLGSRLSYREFLPGSLLLLHIVSGFVYAYATILHPGPVI